MEIFRTTFDWAGELYNQLFADWLHVHFIIRTVVLILAFWFAIYICGLFVRYLVLPFILLLFYHTIFRAWNYFFVETPQEWIYIRHYSRGKLKFRRTYLRLCDKVKNNRLKIQVAKYFAIVMRVRPITTGMMFSCGLVVAVWVIAFGMHHQYYRPAMAGNIDGTVQATMPPTQPPTQLQTVPPQPTPTYDQYIPEPIAPPTWLYEGDWDELANIVFKLTDHGQQGVHLRSGPGVDTYVIVEILWDNDRLVYLHSYYLDNNEDGLYWFRVLSPRGAEGYVSSQFVYMDNSGDW